MSSRPSPRAIHQDVSVTTTKSENRNPSSAIYRNTGFCKERARLSQK